MIRLFETGNEAAAAVLGTALYQALPPATDGPAAALPGRGRKLLFFSDSRQAAAYFAPYLEGSYTRIQHRRLMTQAVLKGCPGPDEPMHIDDLVAHTVRAADRAGVFRRNDSRQAKQREVALWVMQEVLSIDDRQSLEGLGLLRVDLDREPFWQPPASLTSLGLSDDEAWWLMQELLRTVRNQGALTMPEDVDAGDEAFSPRRGPVWVRSKGSDAKRKVISWLPSAAVSPTGASTTWSGCSTPSGTRATGVGPPWRSWAGCGSTSPPDTSPTGCRGEPGRHRRGTSARPRLAAPAARRRGQRAASRL